MGLREFYRITATNLPIIIEGGIYAIAILLFVSIYLRNILLVPAILAFFAHSSYS
jgi:hypothetical protein